MATDLTLLINKLDSFSFYYWKTEVVYEKDSFVTYRDGVYRSNHDNNLSNDPIYSNSWTQII